MLGLCKLWRKKWQPCLGLFLWPLLVLVEIGSVQSATSAMGLETRTRNVPSRSGAFCLACRIERRTTHWSPQLHYPETTCCDKSSTSHEYRTLGDFTPYLEGNGSSIQNTANSLCGTGKLNPETERKVCNFAPAEPGSNQAPVAPTQELAPPSLEDQAKQAQQYADCLKSAVGNPTIVCKQ